MTGSVTIKPKKGDHTAEADAAHWVVTCAFHRGDTVLDHHTVIDPATGKPRLALHVAREGGDMIVHEEQALIPEYSDDIGYQPDCESCIATVQEVRQAVMQRRVDLDQAAYELDLQLRALGLADNQRQVLVEKRRGGG